MPQRIEATSVMALSRCGWATNDPLYIAYHDREWGSPLHDDGRLFELLILEGAQAGLSWITILRKRESYRAAFDDFELGRRMFCFEIGGVGDDTCLLAIPPPRLYCRHGNLYTAIDAFGDVLLKHIFRDRGDGLPARRLFVADTQLSKGRQGVIRVARNP